MNMNNNNDVTFDDLFDTFENIVKVTNFEPKRVMLELCQIGHYDALLSASYFLPNKQRELLRNLKKTYFNYQSDLKDFFEILFLLLTKEIDDYLGKIYYKLFMQSFKKAQHFTPIEISRCCSDILLLDFDKKESDEVSVISDITCGSGSMLLGAVNKVRGTYGDDYDTINKKYLFYGADIDLTCVMMCLLQLDYSFVKATVVHADTLLNKTYNEYHSIIDTLMA